MKKWREFHEPIAWRNSWRSNAKPKQMRSLLFYTLVKPLCQVASASVLPGYSYIVTCISRIFKRHSNFTLKYNYMRVVFDHE